MLYYIIHHCCTFDKRVCSTLRAWPKLSDAVSVIIVYVVKGIYSILQNKNILCKKKNTFKKSKTYKIHKVRDV